MPDSVQSCFELAIHFPVFFFRELFLAAVHGWFAKQTNGTGYMFSPTAVISNSLILAYLVQFAEMIHSLGLAGIILIE